MRCGGVTGKGRAPGPPGKAHVASLPGPGPAAVYRVAVLLMRSLVAAGVDGADGGWRVRCTGAIGVWSSQPCPRNYASRAGS